MMQIAVVGGGGVGGYVAAKLIRAGAAEVTLFARGAHLAAIEASGLQVIDHDETFTVHPDTRPPQPGTRFDAVFLAVKSYDLASACRMVAPFVGEETVVVPLSNGVDHAAEIAACLQRGIVCEGCVHVISHIASPGVIEKRSPLFYLIFGAERIDARMRRLEQLLNASGLKSKCREDARYACWKKYLFIATFAMLTAYHAMPMDRVWREHRDEAEALLAEIRSVANGLGVPIDEADIAQVRKQAENLPPDAKTSMQRDFEAGRRTELETLGGYIVRKGAALGIEVPLMRKLYGALSQRGA